MSRQFLDEKIYAVNLAREDAFEDFRDAARALIGADSPPSDVARSRRRPHWREGATGR